MKKDIKQHQIEIIVDLYDSGLLSFREIGERADIQLNMTTVRNIYRREKGKHISNKVKRFDKMEELDTKYQELWKKQEKERKELELKKKYW